jgi:hypothetical protein
MVRAKFPVRGGREFVSRRREIFCLPQGVFCAGANSSLSDAAGERRILLLVDNLISGRPAMFVQARRLSTPTA